MLDVNAIGCVSLAYATEQDNVCKIPLWAAYRQQEKTPVSRKQSLCIVTFRSHPRALPSIWDWYILILTWHPSLCYMPHCMICLSLLFCNVNVVVNGSNSIFHAATHSNALRSSVKPSLPCNLSLLLYQAVQLPSRSVICWLIPCCGLHSWRLMRLHSLLR